MKHLLRILAIFCLMLLFFSGCDIRGANDPFSYAATKPYTVYLPPKPKAYYDPLKDFSHLQRATPFTLAEMIDITLLQNPSTQETWAEARASAAEYGQSLKKDFILADINGSYMRQRSAEFTGDVRTIIYETQYGAELDLTYRILDFGQTRNSSLAALNALYKADWLHNNAIQKVLQNLMDAYYTYLFQKQQVESAEKDVADAQVSLDAVMERLENGVADISDQVQAETTLLKRKLDVVTAKQNLTKAYTKLLDTMGIPATYTLVFQEYPKTIEPVSPQSIEKLIEIGFSNRPDILAAEASVVSYKKQLQAAKAKRYPTLDGGFNIGRQYQQKGLNDNYDFQATLSLNFPLFRGFFIENEIKKESANLSKAIAELEKVRLRSLEEITNYQSDILYAKESLQYAADFLLSAEEDFRINLQKYKVGTATIVDVINAETAVADARTRVAKSKQYWYSSIANLANATGLLLPGKQEFKQVIFELTN